MAEQALKLVNGVPRMVDIGTSAGAVYDETIFIGSNQSPGSTFTLPNGGNYDDIDLEIFVDGHFMEPTIDYNYVGVAPNRTQITFIEGLNQGSRLRFRVEDSDVTIYDEGLDIGAGGITTGTNITLPNGGSYVGEELEIYLNGEFMEYGIDWTDVGSAPKSDIQMTFNLVEGDRLRFRKDYQ